MGFEFRDWGREEREGDGGRWRRRERGSGLVMDLDIGSGMGGIVWDKRSGSRKLRLELS